MTRQIVYNAIKTPDGTVIESVHRHDYVVYTDKNGKEYSVDGGCDYLKRLINGCVFFSDQDDNQDGNYNGAQELSVTSDDQFEKIRTVLKWGTYGKSGKEKLHHVTLEDMANEHIKAILGTQSRISPFYERTLESELEYRVKNKIEITN